MSARVLFPILLLARLTHADPAFVRVDESDRRKQLQTCVVEYVHPSGVRVSLVATVHLAERRYFDSIRARFRGADVVIHEGVRRLHTRPLLETPKVPTGLVSQSQTLACRGETFVVGDLDEVAFDAVRDRSVRIGGVPDNRAGLAASVLRAMNDPDVSQATDRAFAIEPRNTAALTALRHRLARGDAQILLLYGASHAPDLDRRLIEELGFARGQSVWLDAFGL